MAFKSFIVEIAGKYVESPNIKIKVGAHDHEGANRAALLRKEANGRTMSDIIKTHCSSLKPNTGKRLSVFTAPTKRA